MRIAKRLTVFLLTNLLIVGTISVVTSAFGLQSYLTASGISFQSLVFFCLMWGFGGAFISLALSRVMAKWMMGVKVINPESNAHETRWLYETVSRLASQAGLARVPEVGIYESAEMNAFATGPTKSRSLVAVSTGLLRNMGRHEIEGVLAHEVAHIANGDMVTMTLVQGVVNAFVMFFARVIAWSISQLVDEEKRGIVNFVSVFLFEIVFSLLGMLVVAFFSRIREYQADGDAAALVGKSKMIAALKSLQSNIDIGREDDAAVAALKISASRKVRLFELLATHPPLEDRIKRLQAA